MFGYILVLPLIVIAVWLKNFHDSMALYIAVLVYSTIYEEFVMGVASRQIGYLRPRDSISELGFR